MTTRWFLLFTAMQTAAALAVETLIDPHADLSVNFTASLVGTATNPWRLTVRDEDRKHEYGGQRTGFGDPLEVIMRAGIEAQFPVPEEPEYSFLGTPGAPIWVLPQTQEPGILYLGASTENKSSQTWTAHNVLASLLAIGIPAGSFFDNQITLRLESFSGPGNFFVWTTDSFGQPDPRIFDTSNGLTAGDSRTLTRGNHAHFNWAFTAPGTYLIGLRASGTLTAGNQFTQSELTTFRFDVIPEPSTIGLALGGLALLVARRIRRCNSV